MGLLDRLRGGALAPSATPPPADPSSPGVSRFAVIDVETTGLDPERERVLELAILRADEQGRPIDQWVTRFHPGGPVRATHIHGITDADVAGAPRFADLAVQIGTALRGLVLVAHNAEFDLRSFRRSSPGPRCRCRECPPTAPCREAPSIFPTCVGARSPSAARRSG